MTKSTDLATRLCLCGYQPSAELCEQAATELIRLQNECDSERRARIASQSELQRMREQAKEKQS